MKINPLFEGLQFSKEPSPFAFVIFGVTGDLTRRKLMPALFSLFTKGLITQFKVIGFARRPWTKTSFQKEALSMLQGEAFQKVSQELKEDFLSHLDYISSTFNDIEGYKTLKQALEGWESRFFYLSTSSDEYPNVVNLLSEVALHRPCSNGYTRIIIEKPFGRDLSSAQALNDILARQFDEHQIYRIDHYLGKETVQNILALRFGNSVFEPIWNNRYIDHIQITCAESLGVESRGNYYEKSGALRDMVQNHLLQLLALLTMEAPYNLSADNVRTEKVKILKSLKPITAKDVKLFTVRGQYTEGLVQGQLVPGYWQEDHVASDSRTETFVALKLFLSTRRWKGVPILLRTGKRLGRQMTEAAIFFKEPLHQIFSNSQATIKSNRLIIRLQPEEEVSLSINAKIPGYTMQISPVSMDFTYQKAFGKLTTEAYERLILDALVGDSTLYTRRDEIETSWTFITRILQGWACDPSPLPLYRAGSCGPQEAKELLSDLKHKWRRI